MQGKIYAGTYRGHKLYSHKDYILKYTSPKIDGTYDTMRELEKAIDILKDKKSLDDFLEDNVKPIGRTKDPSENVCIACEG